MNAPARPLARLSWVAFSAALFAVLAPRASFAGPGMDPGSVVGARPSRRTVGPAERARAARDLGAGRQALAAGRPAKALDLLREAVRLAPDAADYKALGRAYEALGRYYKAAWAYRHSLGYADDAGLRDRIASLKAKQARELQDARLHDGPRPKP